MPVFHSAYPGMQVRICTGVLSGSDCEFQIVPPPSVEHPQPVAARFSGGVQSCDDGADSCHWVDSTHLLSLGNWIARKIVWWVGAHSWSAVFSKIQAHRLYLPAVRF